MDEMKTASDSLEEALLMMNRIQAEKIIIAAAGQSNTLEGVEKLVTTALERIGQGWQEGRVALAQVYMSGVICEETITRIMTLHPAAKKKQTKIAIAVLEDYHQLGKRIVCSILRATGYDVIDYGAGVSVDDLIQKTIEDEVEVLLIATLMLPAAMRVKNVVEGLRQQGSKTKIIAGGAPFRLDFQLAHDVGVDTVVSASDLPALIEQVVKKA